MTDKKTKQLEIWKDIKGYESIYKVSNMGKLKRLKRTIVSKVGIPRTHKQKLLSLNGLDQDGYVLTVLTDQNHKLKTQKVHRLVAQAFIPNPENKPFVNHKNGIKNDNRVENLEWVTAKENSRHAVDTNLKIALKGEEIGNSILNEDLVKEMRQIKQYYTYTELQEIYGVNRSTIHLAVTGKNWKHIK